MLFPKKFLKTQGHEALLISSAANHYPHCTFFTDCILSFVLNPYITTLTIALDSFLAHALRLLQGQGKAVELFMISWQTTENTAKLPAGSVYTFFQKCITAPVCAAGCAAEGVAGVAPQRLWNPTKHALPHTRREDCQDWSTSSSRQDCKIHVLWMLSLIYNSK